MTDQIHNDMMLMYEDSKLRGLRRNLALSYSVFGKYNQNNPSAHYASHQPTYISDDCICLSDSVNVNIGVGDDIIPDDTVSI